MEVDAGKLVSVLLFESNVAGHENKKGIVAVSTTSGCPLIEGKGENRKADGDCDWDMAQAYQGSSRGCSRMSLFLLLLSRPLLADD